MRPPPLPTFDGEDETVGKRGLSSLCSHRTGNFTDEFQTPTFVLNASLRIQRLAEIINYYINLYNFYFFVFTDYATSCLYRRQNPLSLSLYVYNRTFVRLRVFRFFQQAYEVTSIADLLTITFSPIYIQLRI